MKTPKSPVGASPSAVDPPASPEDGGAEPQPGEDPAEAQTVNCMVDQKIIDRLEALAAKLSTPWLTVTRTSILRKVILSGMEIIEKESRASNGDVKH